jgi:hypothetical protein
MAKIHRRPGSKGFFLTFQLHPVCDEWKQELYNYFMEGLEPGSFHRACYENNMLKAAFRSHPANHWKQIQEFMKWCFANAPAGSFGDEEKVNAWLSKSAEERRLICIRRGWQLTDKEITWDRISNE